jgi:hypothetical protein
MTSLEIDVSSRGLDFEDTAERLDPELRALLIERLAEIAYWKAFYGAPWRKGDLARSLVKEVEGDRAAIKLTSPYGSTWLMVHHLMRFILVLRPVWLSK